MTKATLRVPRAAPRQYVTPPEEFIGSDAFIPAALAALAEGVRLAVADDKRRGKTAHK